MPFIHVDGAEINYRIDDFTDPWADKSKLKTIVMHHAAHRGLETFTPWIPTLARKYRVVRFDTRGVGGSTAPPEPFKMTVQHLIDDSITLLNELGLKDVHWVGTQSGGVVGLVIAATRPELIRSLTVCNSPYRYSGSFKAKLAGLPDMTPGEALRKLGFWEWRNRTFGSSVDEERSDPRMVEWIKGVQSKVPIHIMASQMDDGAKNLDISGLLKNVTCPTLFMNGDRGNQVSNEDLHFMVNEVKNSRLLIFPNIGDSIHLIIGEKCARATLDFLTEIDGG
jgi:3-oxoadipate enol-lactonase